MKEKILISGCFLGQLVRYNGKIKTFSHPLLENWRKEQRLVSVCPEVVGGLLVPRPAAEIQGNRVVTYDGLDVTDKFVTGAEKALALCQHHKIRFALLKEYSPSCGSQMIYDGSFSENKIIGQGICTQLGVLRPSPRN